MHTTLPIPAYIPMLVFAIVFGLSMDYEVFLLSRVHEAWIETGDPHRAVAVGIGATPGSSPPRRRSWVVVFASFVLSTDPTVKMLARAWWMPRWLEPIVPHLQLEGSTTPAAPAAQEPAAPEAVGPAKTKTAEDETDKEAEAATATGARRRPSAK